MTKTLTLTEFLLARIAEDDDAALGLDRDAHIGGRWVDFGERYRLECEAKRQIVGRYAYWNSLVPTDPGACLEARHAVRLLAAVYVDHPDFREEWKP